MSGDTNCTTKEEDCPRLITKTRTPKVLWYQTDTTVVIRILLVDVSQYYLQVGMDEFHFSTILNDQDYCVSFKLYGTVIAEKTIHTNLFREIKVLLIKAHKWTEWLRLRLTTEKSALIVVDPDHIVKKEWDDPLSGIEERESFSEYKKRNNITNIMPPESSSSEDASSDDEAIRGYD